MQSLNIDSYGMQTITDLELAEIDGGVHSTAYNVGHAVGEFVVACGACCSLAAVFLGLSSPNRS